MSFSILFKDEFRYFYKTGAMLYLWVGLPLIIGMTRLMPGQQGPLHQAVFGAYMATSLASMIAGSMIAASLISEIKQKVYIPFLTRPFKKGHIVLSRFFTVQLSLLAVFLTATLAAVVIDLCVSEAPFGSVYVYQVTTSLSLGFCVLSVSCALGVLVGVLSASLYSGIIIYLLISNIINPMLMLVMEAIGKTPGDLLLLKNSLLLGIGAGVPFVLLALSLRVFRKEEF
ncbi:MAG: hypothetical protein GY765_04395 [bacterium]|nr:hypothetical protein [bacterium]